MTADKPRNIGAQKKSPFRCRRFWWQVVPTLLFGVFLLTLPFGDCQWTRLHYMFQAYIWPKAKDGWLDPPAHYSGKWQRWYSNGKIFSDGEFFDGLESAYTTFWYENGQKQSEYIFLEHKGISRGIRWWKNGQKQIEYFRKNLRPYGIWKTWLQKGQPSSVEYFLEGKEVTISQYLAACAKDPTLPKPMEVAPENNQ